MPNNTELNTQPEQLPIRVWWGFMNPGLLVAPNKGIESFEHALSTDFMPDTVYIMSYVLTALIAYLPTVLLDVSQKLSGIIPDEVALVVYKSIDEYNAATEMPLAQLYQHIHAWLFAIPPSNSGGFPQLFRETFAFDKPCFLYTKDNVDWQGGTTRLIVAKPNSRQSTEDFRQVIEKYCAELQLAGSASNADCVILRASPQCLTLWRHYPPGIQADDNDIAQLLSEIQVVSVKDSVKVGVPSRQEYNLAKNWLSIIGNESLNFQFAVVDTDN